MAKKGGSRRIEPSFNEPRKAASGRLAVSEDDRVLPSRQRRKRSAKTARKPKRRSRMGLFGRAIYWGFVLCIWVGIAGLGVAAYYGAQMPAADTWAVPKRPPNVKIVAVDGKLLANRGVTGGEAVGLHEMSPYIPQAVIAIEDRRFYSHFGIDPLGVTRALASNVIGGRLSQGGSTLTQQLAKNLFLTPERTIRRKVQEVLLSLWLEQKYTKDQILEMYLNRVYFGSGAYGVEAASRRYFSKSARNVTLAEAALLAGLLKAPSRLSPARDAKAANERAEVVLSTMRDQGMIGAKELSLAMKAAPTRAASYWSGSENYVADYVMRELPGLIGEVRTDLIVETTIDLTLQKLGEESIRSLIARDGKKLNVSQGALVSVDNTGAVRAMVGGYDYAASQFDRASAAMRQPGSSFKPFVFLAAVERGATPDTMRNDAPVRIGNWTPQNYKGKYYGQVTLTTALAKSLNSVAAQLAAEAGAATVVKTAQRLGIKSKLQTNTSIALGTSEVTPLELTAAYVPFANGGYRPTVHIIKSISTAGGKQLYHASTGDMPRVVTPEAVGMMNVMMQETIRSGTAGKAEFGWPAAGKTGTSQKSKDAWFIGYTANLTTGVWFGNDDGTPTKDITGGSLPTIAWRQFMEAAHQGVPVRPLPGNWQRRLEPPPSVGQPVAGADGGFNSVIRSPRASDTPTGSIRRPSADVGDGKVRQEKSLLDIILGN